MGENKAEGDEFSPSFVFQGGTKSSNAARTLQYQVLYIMPKYRGFCPKKAVNKGAAPQQHKQIQAPDPLPSPGHSLLLPSLWQLGHSSKKTGKKARSCCCSQFGGSFECPVRDGGGEEPSPAPAAGSQHPAHPPQARTEHLHHSQTPVLWAGFPPCTLSHRPGDSAALPVIPDALETQKVY